MSKLPIAATALVIVSCIFCPAIVRAQTVSISGRVVDVQGGAVNGALVTLSGSGATAKRTTRTGADGTFSLDAVTPGSVTLKVESAGFEPWMQTVMVSATSAPVDVMLQIAGVVETVGVVAPKLEETLPQLIERGGSRAQTITSAQIQNGGYYDVGQTLQALAPTLFLTPKAGPFDYVTASLQGSRTNEILWLVDGVRISNRLYFAEDELIAFRRALIERARAAE